MTDTSLSAWTPLLGRRYAEALLPLQRRLGRTALLNFLAPIAVVGSMALFPNAAGISLAAVVVALVSLGWWRALRPFDEFGRKVQADLRRLGVASDRPAPVRSPALMSRWRARNGVTLADLERASGIEPA